MITLYDGIIKISFDLTDWEMAVYVCYPIYPTLKCRFDEFS